MEIYPGAYHLPRYLSTEAQGALAARCREIGSRPAGFYTPRVRNGRSMSIQMVCLGRHWNARTYTYEGNRSDYDGLQVQKLEDDLARLAMRAAADAGMEIDPDVCILNYYPETGKLGLHQDRDEQAEAIQAGIPIVSISVGDDAEFLIGGFHRSEPVIRLVLRSGDGFVMGGPSRLRYHGVSRILPGTGPEGIGVKGRFNLTFRQSFVSSASNPSAKSANATLACRSPLTAVD